MDFSFVELLVIGVIAFMVFGPEELIRRASQFGKFWVRMRTEFNNLKIMAQEEMQRFDLEENLSDRLNIDVMSTEENGKKLLSEKIENQAKVVEDEKFSNINSTNMNSNISLEAEIEKRLGQMKKAKEAE